MPGTLVVNPDKTFIGILKQRHAHLPLRSEPMPPDFQTAVQIAVLFIFGFRQFGSIVLDVQGFPADAGKEIFLGGGNRITARSPCVEI